MLCLRTLGGLSLENEGKPASGAAGQRAPLALLAFIASTGETGASRDRIASLFWPESDAERAHGSLKQALYSLRRDAGSQDLILGGSALRLNHDVIRCDAAEFTRAIERKEYEAAVALYSGAFLDGVHITGNGEFDRWVDGESSRLSEQYSHSLEILAKSATEKGEREAAVQWWRKLATVDRLSGRVARNFMLALAAAGDREAAIRFAEVHERIVASELDAKPDPEITKLVDELRADCPIQTRIISAETSNGEEESGNVEVIQESKSDSTPKRRSLLRRWFSGRMSSIARGGAIGILFGVVGLIVYFQLGPRSKDGQAPNVAERRHFTSRASGGFTREGVVVMETPPLHLTDDLKRELLSHIGPGIPVQVGIGAEGLEARNLATEIHRFLSSAGFDVLTEIFFLASNQRVPGIIVRLPARRHETWEVIVGSPPLGRAASERPK